MSAHQRAVQEAESFCREHPELCAEHDDDRLPTGESARPEKSDLFGSKHGQQVRLASIAASATAQLVALRPGPPMDAWDRAMAAFFDHIFDHLRPGDRDLLLERFHELKTWEQMAAPRGISYQAVQKRTRTALRNLKSAIREHGRKYEHLLPEDL